MQYKFPKIQKFLYYIRFYQVLFYLCAFHWNITHRVKKPVTTREIYELFYLDFLSVPVEDCEIIELNEKKLVTRCKNECFILNLSMLINVDTKKSCKIISEGPCKYFLRKLDKNIKFERNYKHIRPYKNSCEETITIP